MLPNSHPAPIANRRRGTRRTGLRCCLACAECARCAKMPRRCWTRRTCVWRTGRRVPSRQCLRTGSLLSPFARSFLSQALVHTCMRASDNKSCMMRSLYEAQPVVAPCETMLNVDSLGRDTSVAHGATAAPGLAVAIVHRPHARRPPCICAGYAYTRSLSRQSPARCGSPLMHTCTPSISGVQGLRVTEAELCACIDKTSSAMHARTQHTCAHAHTHTSGG